MDLHAWITQQVDATEAEARAVLADPTPLLRRCEADRRILARHRLASKDEWGWIRDPGCHGCGVMGDCDDPVVDSLNDCPELLDLAHAHGITPEILAGLDRPQPPARKVRIHNAHTLADVFSIATPPVTTSDVPAALRGPRWKP